MDELLDDGKGDDDDEGPWSGKEELLAVVWAVSGHHGSLVGEWLTPASGCPETGAPAMGGEALDPCARRAQGSGPRPEIKLGFVWGPSTAHT